LKKANEQEADPRKKATNVEEAPQERDNRKHRTKLSLMNVKSQAMAGLVIRKNMAKAKLDKQNQNKPRNGVEKSPRPMQQ